MQTNENANTSNTTTHVQGVNATPGGLIKATLGAAAVAAAILTFVWLPAEHGIDPTGVGHIIGLTEMGHIKEQLHADADAEATANASTEAGNAEAKAAIQPVLNDSEINQKLDAIQSQLAAIAVAVGTNSPTDSAQTTSATDTSSAAEPTVLWRDEDEYTLIPGQGIEVKLVMDEGMVAEFEWSANGAVVNHDTHGDGLGKSISYKKGRSVSEQSGKLVAAFNGNHGWFWRNRTEKDVVLSLRTRGEYKGIFLP